jgi:hypothetical protein
MSSKNPPAFASASQPSSAEELLGRLAAYRPIESREFETRIGNSVGTVTQVVLIGDDGAVEDLGERPVFWTVVRRQLQAATVAVPWIAGRLVQSGQAYRLDAITEGDEPAVRKALGSL